MFCIHKYKIHSEKQVGEWSDVGKIYTTLLTCEKCGKAKYISNYTDMTVRIFQGLGIGIIIGVIVFACNMINRSLI